MWITPAPIRLPSMFWVSIDERATSGHLPFSDSPSAVEDEPLLVPVSLVLYKHKSLVSGRIGGFLDTLTAKVTQLDVGAESPLTYRLVLHVGGPDRTGFECENSFLLAVSDERTTMWNHWEAIVGPNGVLSEIATQMATRQSRETLVTVSRRDEPVGPQPGWTVAAGAGDVQRDVTANFDLLSQPAVQEYVMGKVAAFAQTEEGEPVKNVEAEIARFRSAFAELATEPGFSRLKHERLITFFKCSLWKGFPRRGTLFVTEHYICFDPQGTAVERAIGDGVAAAENMVDARKNEIVGDRTSLQSASSETSHLGNRVVLKFRDIRCLTKEMALGGLLNNTIKVGIERVQRRGKGTGPVRGAGSSSLQDEFYSFAFLQRDPVFELLERVWSKTMDRLLAQHAKGARVAWIPRHVEEAAASGNSSRGAPDLGSVSTPPTNASSESRIHTSKRELDTNLQQDIFSSTFRVFSENPLDEFTGSVWIKASYLLGTVYVTENTICYQSNFSVTGKAVQVVCPLVLVSHIEKTSPLGFLRNGISMQLPHGRSLDLLVYSRDKCFDLLAERWQHVRSRLTKRAVDAAKPLDDEWVLSQIVPQVAGDMQGWTLDATYIASPDHKRALEAEPAWGEFESKFGAVLPWSFRTPKFLFLVRSGVPDHRRRYLWQMTSGSYYSWVADQDSQSYLDILARHEGTLSPAAEEIEKDLRRALPSHPFFASTRTTVPRSHTHVLQENAHLRPTAGLVEGESDAPGIDSLRRVLTAFAWRNPEVGYCQSMNIIAACFLLYMPEEETYWLLTTVCERIVPHYYTRELLGSQVDQFVFNSLVEHNLPRIDAKLKEVGVPLELLTLPWFMCLFVTYIPWAASLRVLDCFFAEGPDVLFKVGLALLSLCEEDILREDDPEAILRIARTTGGVDGKVDVNELLRVAFSEFGFLPTSRINELRNTKRIHQIQHIAETNRKRLLLSAGQRVGDDLTADELEEYFDMFNAELYIDSSDLALGEEELRSLFFRVFGPTQHLWWDMQIPAPSSNVSGLQRVLQLFGFDSLEPGNFGQRLLDFLGFADLLAVALKGSMADRFGLCFRLVDANKVGRISLAQCVLCLQLLHQMTFDEEHSIRDGREGLSLGERRLEDDNASVGRLTEFATTTLAKAASTRTTQQEVLDGDPSLFTCEEIVGVCIAKPLLPAFWFLDF